MPCQPEGGTLSDALWSALKDVARFAVIDRHDDSRGGPYPGFEGSLTVCQMCHRILPNHDTKCPIPTVLELLGRRDRMEVG